VRASAGVPVPLLDLAAILDHKLALLAAATPDRPCEAKHDRDARLLGTLCGREVPAVRPQALHEGIYSQDLTASCARCEASADGKWPLAPKGRIHAVLGYV
jgi:hypothetical protein